MALLPFLAGAMLVALMLFSGIGLLSWLFPTTRADTHHKKQS
jgi:hypothetical protein